MSEASLNYTGRLCLKENQGLNMLLLLYMTENKKLKVIRNDLHRIHLKKILVINLNITGELPMNQLLTKRQHLSRLYLLFNKMQRNNTSDEIEKWFEIQVLTYFRNA